MYLIGTILLHSIHIMSNKKAANIRRPIKVNSNSPSVANPNHQSVANSDHQSVANSNHQSVKNPNHRSVANSDHQSVANSDHQSVANPNRPSTVSEKTIGDNSIKIEIKPMKDNIVLNVTIQVNETKSASYYDTAKNTIIGFKDGVINKFKNLSIPSIPQIPLISSISPIQLFADIDIHKIHSKMNSMVIANAYLLSASVFCHMLNALAVMSDNNILIHIVVKIICAFASSKLCFIALTRNIKQFCPQQSLFLNIALGCANYSLCGPIYSRICNSVVFGANYVVINI